MKRTKPWNLPSVKKVFHYTFQFIPPAAHASVRRFPFRLAEIGFNFSERKQPNILVGNGEALFSYLDSTERPYLVSQKETASILWQPLNAHTYVFTSMCVVCARLKRGDIDNERMWEPDFFSPFSKYFVLNIPRLHSGVTEKRHSMSFVKNLELVLCFR